MKNNSSTVSNSGINSVVARNNRGRLISYLSNEGVLRQEESALIEKLRETDYFYGPSSTKWHAAYPGGGFDHAMNVTETLVWLTKSLDLKWSRPISPYLIGILHDMTKTGGRYTMKQERDPLSGETKIWYEYNNACRKLSDIHGEDSLLKAMELISLTEEEQACIRWHMGAYETDNWAGYDAAIKQFPNVLFTHTADMYASKIMEKGVDGNHA